MVNDNVHILKTQKEWQRQKKDMPTWVPHSLVATTKLYLSELPPGSTYLTIIVHFIFDVF